MESRHYDIRLLPTFESDLCAITDYISNNLRNQKAALQLIIDVENAIYKRAKMPTAFEPFYSNRKRKHQYFRIYVRGYTIFYVVYDGVMEVRRIIYSGRNLKDIL